MLSLYRGRLGWRELSSEAPGNHRRRLPTRFPLALPAGGRGEQEGTWCLPQTAKIQIPHSRFARTGEVRGLAEPEQAGANHRPGITVRRRSGIVPRGSLANIIRLFFASWYIDQNRCDDEHLRPASPWVYATRVFLENPHFPEEPSWPTNAAKQLISRSRRLKSSLAKVRSCGWDPKKPLSPSPSSRPGPSRSTLLWAWADSRAGAWSRFSGRSPRARQPSRCR